MTGVGVFPLPWDQVHVRKIGISIRPICILAGQFCLGESLGLRSGCQCTRRIGLSETPVGKCEIGGSFLRPGISDVFLFDDIGKG